MTLSTSEKLFLVIALIDFAGAFVCIGVSLHLAYTKANIMLDNLKNSSLITVLTAFEKGGALGKLLLIGGISGMVTFPNFHIRRGKLCAHDLNKFPIPLKRKLVVLQWCTIGFLLVMIGLAGAVKLGIV